MNDKEIKFMLKQLDLIILDLTIKSHSYESAKIVNESLRLRFELLKYIDQDEIKNKYTPLVDPEELRKAYCEFLEDKKREDLKH